MSREAAEQIVKQEREQKDQEQMPVYKGLEHFKIVTKMGESVAFPVFQISYSFWRSGAFSNVYHAVDLTTNKKVAGMPILSGSFRPSHIRPSQSSSQIRTQCVPG
jgi:hypothetical protein